MSTDLLVALCVLCFAGGAVFVMAIITILQVLESLKESK